MSTFTKKWLFNPFEYVAGSQALVIGLAVILVAGILNIFSQAHFDGILDIHFGEHKHPFYILLSEGFIDWMVFAIILFISGLIFSSSTIRFIDVAGTQAMARWPYLIAAIACCLIPHQAVDAYLSAKYIKGATVASIQTVQWIWYVIMLMILLITLVWMIVLMYKAYSVSCNLKGARGIWSFIVALVLAEVATKFIISLLLKL